MLGQIEKLLERLKSKPKDFTFDEVEKLLNSFGYKLYRGGFNVRISPELHKKAVIAAISKQMSLNNFVENSIEQAIMTE